MGLPQNLRLTVLAGNFKLMQMAITPAHHGLDDRVQFAQGDVLMPSAKDQVGIDVMLTSDQRHEGTRLEGDNGQLELRCVLAHGNTPEVGWVSNFWGALHGPVGASCSSCPRKARSCKVQVD